MTYRRQTSHPHAAPPVPLNHCPAHAAIRLGVSRSTLYELLVAKEIRAIKVGTRTLIPDAELERFVASRMPSV